MPLFVSSLDMDLDALGTLIGSVAALLVAVTTLVTVLRNNKHLRDIKNGTMNKP